MATKGGQTGSSQSDGSSRNWLALGVVIFGFASITILAVVAIINPSSNSNGMTILNMVLPVVATWIGTVLAFFFGRANFESANLQVQQLVDRVQQELNILDDKIAEANKKLSGTPSGKTITIRID